MHGVSIDDKGATSDFLTTIIEELILFNNYFRNRRGIEIERFGDAMHDVSTVMINFWNEHCLIPLQTI